MRDRVANIISLVITTVWAISFLADIIMTTYEPPAQLHAIMMIVAGAILGTSVVRRNGSVNGSN